jgi:hypothetical protein
MANLSDIRREIDERQTAAAIERYTASLKQSVRHDAYKRWRDELKGVDAQLAQFPDAKDRIHLGLEAERKKLRKKLKGAPPEPLVVMAAPEPVISIPVNPPRLSKEELRQIRNVIISPLQRHPSYTHKEFAHFAHVSEGALKEWLLGRSKQKWDAEIRSAVARWPAASN